MMVSRKSAEDKIKEKNTRTGRESKKGRVG